MNPCYCGSEQPFFGCCEPYIIGKKQAPTAEALMRSRYSAYAIFAADYLVQTTHQSTRNLHKKSDILEWAKGNNWTKLEIVETTSTTVTFNAFYTNKKGLASIHVEKSSFVFENGSWFYVDGEY